LTFGHAVYILRGRTDARQEGADAMDRPEIVTAVNKITGCHGYSCGDYSLFPLANSPAGVGEHTRWYVAGPGVVREFAGEDRLGDGMAFLRACADAAEDKAVCERIAAEHEGYAAEARARDDEWGARPHDDESARHRRRSARVLTAEALDRRLADGLTQAASHARAFGRPTEANEMEERAKRFRDSLVRRMVLARRILEAA
jgi:hypothetical protein